jgi:antitoxin component YwqK of YwqJK toxin-antitoxin module
VRRLIKLFLVLFYVLLFNNGNAQSFIIDGNDTINRLILPDSLREGNWREYFGTGNLRSDTWYQKGKKEGLELTWYNIPHCLKSEVNYKAGQINGIANYYSRWCNIDKSENYFEGKKSGEQKTYYSNGSVKVSGVFKDGALKNQYQHFDKEGKLAFESTSLTSEADLSDSALKPIEKPIETILLATKGDLSNTLIVVDVTGSMYDVCGQVLKWLYGYLLEHKHPLNFVFFNDGDKFPDALKLPGNVGGIYTIRSDNWVDIKHMMQQAIKGGSGGDARENDCEAIVKGLEKFPSAKKIILIADNTAPVRDLFLLKRIKKPVDILLCNMSEDDAVLEDYIWIALNTKGSLGTLNETFSTFTTPNFTGVLNVNGHSYYVGDGRVLLQE